MSLLRRIATSNGDQHRKAAANQTLAAMDQQTVSEWHRRLQRELYRKAQRNQSK